MASVMKKGQRFSYVKYDQQAVELQAKFRAKTEELEDLVNQLPEGRYKSLAFTALEEFYAWTGKSVRDDQVQRTGQVDEQPERTDS